MRFSKADFLNKGVFPGGINKIGRIFLFICVFILGEGAAGVSPIFAQTEFSIPEHIQTIAFDQKIDISSWNHFNRVEGLFAGGELALALPAAKLGLVGGAGYAFSQKKPHYHLFALKDFVGKSTAVELGGGYFDHVASADNWTIGEIENSFAAILLHEDFRDYYGLKGWRGWVQLTAQKWLTLRALVQSARYASLKKNTDWHLIPNHKSFRKNPVVAEGQENLFRFALVVDRMDNPIYPTQGFFFQTAFERALSNSKTDFREYSGLFSTLRVYHQAVKDQKIGLLFRAARTWHAAYLPQHLVDLGGLGSLRGFRTKAFPNASSVLFGRFTYFFGGDMFNSRFLSWLPFSDMIELGLFAETGKRWYSNMNIVCEKSPCNPLEMHGRWHSDAGVSFSISGDLVRLDLAHPVNEAGSWRILVRVLPKW